MSAEECVDIGKEVADLGKLCDKIILVKGMLKKEFTMIREKLTLER